MGSPGTSSLCLVAWVVCSSGRASCKQGSFAVVGIMQDVLRTIKFENNEIENVYFRQDNAGCHSSSTILSYPVISACTGIKICHIDFSDAQGEKGTADRLVATCKSHVRIIINEGTDVTTAQQLKEALMSHGGIEGVWVFAMNDVNEISLVEEKIPSISKLNNFAFHAADSITAWCAYGLGNGKEIPLAKNLTSALRVTYSLYTLYTSCI